MEQPFLSFNMYLRNLFGQRVQRVSVDAGMTCPNRDGTLGTGGCIYCDNASFFHGNQRGVPIKRQMEAGMQRAAARYGARLFLAYFQTFTNTYAPVAVLRKCYYESLDFAQVVGIMIGTRPDCISPEISDLLVEIAGSHLVWVELGVQTSHERTLRCIHRGHSFTDSVKAIKHLHSKGIPVAVHVILGLPGESFADMMATAEKLAELPIQGIKLHHLHAVKNTQLAKMYERGEWKPQSEAEYIYTASEFLRRLPPGIVVMRLVGACPAKLLIAPEWTLRKNEVHRRIIAALRNNSD